jgi:hypothetical protein
MADKSIPQLGEKTDLATGDLFHIVRSNVDYKIKKENLENQLAGAISKTYSEATTLITNNTLIQGRFYLITDKADGGILIQAVSTNAFSLHAVGFYYVPDFQDVGAQTGNIKGVWHSGLAALTANISIAFYNGLHYRNLTGNVGTAPSGDAVNWVALAKTLANGYILDEDVLEYVFPTDVINWRTDLRGNRIPTLSHSTFQWGNTNCSKNICISFYTEITNINQRGLISGNVFASSKVTFSSSHVGSNRYNYFNSGYDSTLTADSNTSKTIQNSTFNYINTNTTVTATLNYYGVTFDFDTQYATPLTGATVTCTTRDRKIVLNPAGTIATLTISLPLTAGELYDGQILDITTTQIVTAVTMSGGTVVGMPAGLSVGFHRLTYIESTANWYY